MMSGRCGGRNDLTRCLGKVRIGCNSDEMVVLCSLCKHKKKKISCSNRF